ncbi:MAG: sugar nucleotide-binding protein [Alphaproteobacteria bacterium]|nr:sugar nucleotide-binding protein [Alphaproteobacteria bacterium]
MQRTLVIGGSGQLGQALVRAAAGEVHATFLTRRPVLAAAWHPLDLRDRDALRRLVERVRPTRIACCAYVQGGPDLRTITAEAPGWVAEASGEARLVHLSSDVVFPGHPEPVDETSARAPVHAYGDAKVESEDRVLEARPDALIVRTSLLWGAPEGVQERLAREAPFPFYADELRRPTHVDDLARAILHWADGPHAGPLHLAGADLVDRAAFARLLAARQGADPTRIQAGRVPPGRPKHLDLVSRFAPPLPGP